MPKTIEDNMIMGVSIPGPRFFANLIGKYRKASSSQRGAKKHPKKKIAVTPSELESMLPATVLPNVFFITVISMPISRKNAIMKATHIRFRENAKNKFLNLLNMLWLTVVSKGLWIM
jgi:hypothetical protein